MSQSNPGSTNPDIASEISSAGNTPNTLSPPLLETFIYGLAHTATIHGIEVVPTAIAAFLEENGGAIEPQVAEALAGWRIQTLKEKADRENEVQVRADRVARLKRFVGQGLDQAWQARKLIQDNPGHPMQALISTAFSITTSLEAAEEILEGKS